MYSALYFGSFNPLHIGHISIAKYIINQPDVSEFTFIVSPQNPIKSSSVILNANERLESLQKQVEILNRGNGVVEISEQMQKYIGNNQNLRTLLNTPLHPDKKFSVSDVEFNLPQPLYTYNTLRYFKDNEPNKIHALIIGGDNLDILNRWHKAEEILNEFQVWVYPRKGVDTAKLCSKYGVKFLDAPMIDISSTEIRQMSAL